MKVSTTPNKNSDSASDVSKRNKRKSGGRIKKESQKSQKSLRSQRSQRKKRDKKGKLTDKPATSEPPPLSHIDLDFWHGMLPNEDTAHLLKENDSYLLRKDVAKDNSGPILLSVRSGDKVLNCLIEEMSTGFRISDREFDTVCALVDYYPVRKISIKTCGKEITLGRAVRRKPWELRHKMVTIQKELGSGSYGVVYSALLSFPREKPIVVAAKMLTEFDLDACIALWKEARVMQEYDHPNITKFYGVCNDSLPYYLVMEFINGGSVDSFLEKNPQLSMLKRTKIAMDAASGLEYLHSKGCIHRDIAARNLLIDDVIAKVADFGLTRKTRNYKIDPDKPMNLRWISPEVFETSTVNKATDVYAYGITLFELFVVPYDVPYSKWDGDEVFVKVVTQDTAPKEIGGMMKECLLEPKYRPSFKTICIFLTAQLKIMAENPAMDKDTEVEADEKGERRKKKK